MLTRIRSKRSLSGLSCREGRLEQPELPCLDGNNGNSHTFFISAHSALHMGRFQQKVQKVTFSVFLGCHFPTSEIPEGEIDPKRELFHWISGNYWKLRTGLTESPLCFNTNGGGTLRECPEMTEKCCFQALP